MSENLHGPGRRYANLTLIPTINRRRIGEELDKASVHLAAVITSSQERTRALDELHRQHGPLSTPADYRRLFAGRPLELSGGDGNAGAASAHVLPGL
jgi:hypothetical protein